MRNTVELLDYVETSNKTNFNKRELAKVLDVNNKKLNSILSEAGLKVSDLGKVRALSELDKDILSVKDSFKESPTLNELAKKVDRPAPAVRFSVNKLTKIGKLPNDFMDWRGVQKVTLEDFADFYKANKGITITELAEHYGLTNRSITRYKRLAYDKGLLTKSEFNRKGKTNRDEIIEVPKKTKSKKAKVAKTTPKNTATTSKTKAKVAKTTTKVAKTNRIPRGLGKAFKDVKRVTVPKLVEVYQMNSLITLEDLAKVTNSNNNVLGIIQKGISQGKLPEGAFGVTVELGKSKAKTPKKSKAKTKAKYVRAHHKNKLNVDDLVKWAKENKGVSFYVYRDKLASEGTDVNVQSIYYWVHKLGLNNKNKTVKNKHKVSKKMTDKQLVKLIAKNPEYTINDLAKKSNWSVSTIRKRIEEFANEGIIEYQKKTPAGTMVK